LVIDNTDKVCGELFLLAEAVVPTVILITRPRAAHAGAAEAENNFLSSSPPRINQSLIILIVTNGHS